MFRFQFQMNRAIAYFPAVARSSGENLITHTAPTGKFSQSVQIDNQSKQAVDRLATGEKPICLPIIGSPIEQMHDKIWNDIWVNAICVCLYLYINRRHALISFNLPLTSILWLIVGWQSNKSLSSMLFLFLLMFGVEGEHASPAPANMKQTKIQNTLKNGPSRTKQMTHTYIQMYILEKCIFTFMPLTEDLLTQTDNLLSIKMMIFCYTH